MIFLLLAQLHCKYSRKRITMILKTDMKWVYPNTEVLKLDPDSLSHLIC
jgi:hypothetical protein